MEYAIKFVATSWLEADELGARFFDHVDGSLAQRDGEWLVTVYQAAPSAREAALAAIEHLERIDFSVRRVDRDLVDIPEIAARLGRKRQNIHQFVTGVRRGTFPVPYAYLGDKRVWLWTDVVQWSARELDYEEEPSLNHDDACWIDAYLAQRRDFVSGNWSNAVHRAGRTSSAWPLARDVIAADSYRRSGLAVAIQG
jgi:predicted DNA-binding transcriptional regulator AlpA